jgi:transitional endoplasmic reticulum ATPase
LFQYKVLASEEISGGFSGAEIVSVCRDAALLAIEEDDEEMNPDDTLMIRMRHLIKAIEITPRQVTRAMLDFYAAYTNSI